ncbi:MAG: DarT ssDNA thymidine ADP-ribosyltransferase family protein [Acidimicrobiia bacterium]|nr:DarT ssDNA thymidine ADP-ribosyltransferase family protein [Acidimicrobiia bacterium]
MTANPIQGKVDARGITRLCHITRSMTLPFIVEMGEIVATSRLDQDELAIYYPNDHMRLDGHKTHVSCSVQYPNAWYLKLVQAREPLFKDWIVLLIEPDPLWWSNTLFCPVNAATEHGRYIAEGKDGFDAMFENFTPTGRIGRGLTHLASCPTDNQAEVLVLDGIPLDLVRCVVVRDEAQAKRERWKLSEFGLSVPELGLAICPEFFDPRALAGRIASSVETDPSCGSFWGGR